MVDLTRLALRALANSAPSPGYGAQTRPVSIAPVAPPPAPNPQSVYGVSQAGPLPAPGYTPQGPPAFTAASPLIAMAQRAALNAGPAISPVAPAINPFALNQRADALMTALGPRILRNAGLGRTFAASGVQNEQEDETWRVYITPEGQNVAMPADYLPPSDWEQRGDDITDPVKVQRAKESPFAYDRQPDDIKAQITRPDQRTANDLQAMQDEARAERPLDQRAVNQLNAAYAARNARSQADQLAMQTENRQQTTDDRRAAQGIQEALAGRYGNEQAQVQAENAAQRMPDARAAQEVQGAVRDRTYYLIQNSETGEQSVVPARVWDETENQSQFTVLSDDLDEQTAQTVQESIVPVGERNPVREAARGDIDRQAEASARRAQDLTNRLLQEESLANPQGPVDALGPYVPLATSPTYKPLETHPTANRRANDPNAQVEDVPAPPYAAPGTYVVVRNKQSGEELVLPAEVWNTTEQDDYDLLRTGVDEQGVPQLLEAQATANEVPLDKTGYQESALTTVWKDFRKDAAELYDDTVLSAIDTVTEMVDWVSDKKNIYSLLKRIQDDPYHGVGVYSEIVGDLVVGGFHKAVEVAGDLWNVAAIPGIEDAGRMLVELTNLPFSTAAEWQVNTVLKAQRGEELSTAEAAYMAVVGAVQTSGVLKGTLENVPYFGLGAWIVSHAEQAQAAYEDGGWEAVWEAYQADTATGIVGVIQRGVRDILNDPLTALAGIGWAADVVKARAGLRVLNPESGPVTKGLARAIERGAGAVGAGARVAEQVSDLGAGYALEGLARLAERSGVTRTTAEHLARTSADEAADAARSVTSRESGVRAPRVYRSDGRLVEDATREAERSADTAARTATPEEVPARWRPRADGEDFVSQVEAADPATGAHLRGAMQTRWNQAERDMRNLGPRDTPTPDQAILSSRVAQDTIAETRALVGQDAALPPFTPNTSQYGRSPVFQATDEIIRLPWDETTLAREYLYSGDPSRYAPAAGARIQGGQTISRNLLTDQATGDQIAAANRYVDVVEQHARWHPGDASSEAFQRAWRRAVELDDELRRRGLRRTPGGNRYRSGGHTPLRDLPLSRQLGIAPSARPVAAVVEAPGDAGEGTSVPYRVLDETTGDHRMPRGFDRADNVQRTFELDADTNVVVQPIQRADITRRSDRLRYPEAKDQPVWYEAFIDDTSGTPAAEGVSTVGHYAPTEAEAVRLAADDAAARGLIEQSADMPPEDATRPATATESDERVVSRESDVRTPSSAQGDTTRAAFDAPSLSAQKADAITEATSGRIAERPPVEPAPRLPTTTPVEPGVRVTEQRLRIVKDADGRERQARTVSVRRGGLYEISAPVHATPASKLWTATTPDGAILRANLSYADALDAVKIEVDARARAGGNLFTPMERTARSASDARPAVGGAHAIRNVTRLSGEHVAGLYDLAIDGNGHVWLWDYLVPPSAVEALTRYTFANGDTMLDRMVRHERTARNVNPTWHPDQTQEWAIVKAKREADADLNRRFRASPNTAAKIIRKRDTYLQFRREMALATWPKAVTYPMLQAVGNAATLVLTGHIGDLSTYLREALPGRGRVRRALMEGMSPEQAMQQDLKNMPMSAQLDVQLGLTPERRVVEAYTKVQQAGFESGPDYTRSKLGVSGLDDDLIITQALANVHPALRPLGKLIGSKWVLKQGQVWDAAMRSAVYAHGVIRELRPTVMQFKARAFAVMEQQGIERAERSHIWREFEGVMNANGTFNARQVRDHFGQYVGDGQGTRLSRDWQEQLHQLRAKVNKELDRITFTGGETNADKVLKRVMMFHYFTSRQSWLYLTMMARHPFLFNAYIDTLETMDRHKDEMLPWQQGWVNLLSLPGIGYAIFANPLAVLSSYTTFQDAADGFENEGNTKVGKAFAWVEDLIGINPLDVAAPDIKDTLNLVGALGHDLPPDPLGIWKITDLVTTGINLGRAYGLFGDDIRPLNNKVEQLFDDARELVSGMNPLRDDAVQADNGQGKVDAQVRRLGEDEAEKRGLDLSDPDDRRIFEAAMADPESAIYKAAVKRYVLGETARDASSFVAGSILRPRGRYTVEASGDRKGQDLNQSRTAQEKAIANTVDPAAIRLKSQADGYYALADDDDTTIADIYTTIAYGSPLYSITVDGRVYTPKEMNAMTPDQRKALADAYLESYGLQDRYYDLLDRRTDYLSKPENREYAQYKEWSKGVRSYEGGVDGYWEEAIETNPAAREYYERVNSQRLLPWQRESRLTSLTAWMYLNGIEPTIFDDVPDRTNTSEQAGRPADPLGIAGTEPQPAEPHVSAWETQLRKDLPQFYTDMRFWDQAVRAKRAELGLDTTLPFNELPGAQRKQVEDALKADKVYEPEQSAPVRSYVEWASQQQPGADLSIEAYLAWNEAQYRRKAPERLEAALDPASTPPSDPGDLWQQVLDLLNEHDRSRYPDQQGASSGGSGGSGSFWDVLARGTGSTFSNPFQVRMP